MARFDVDSAIEELRSASREVSQASSSPTPQALQSLAHVADVLEDVRIDLQRRIRTPISLPNLDAIQQFLDELVDFLSLPLIASTLNRSRVSVVGLINTGYELLDRANSYSLLAEHFFKSGAEARKLRPSDAVDVEIDRITKRADELKRATSAYIGEVYKTLNSLSSQ